MAKDQKSALSIDALLEDLSDDGVRESSGSFTLDPKKAEEKLRSFALASPHDYLLKIVQFAVANGAPEIRVVARPMALEITFDGQQLERSELKSLMAHLLSDDLRPEQRHFRHLAAGMRGATAATPSSVSFQARYEGNGFTRTWDSDGWRLEAVQKSHSGTKHVFQLKRSFGSVFSSVGAEISAAFSGKQLTEEEAWLVGCYQFSPATLFVDGQQVPEHRFGAPRYPGYKIAEDPHPGEAKPPPYLVSSELIDGLVHPDHHLVEARYLEDNSQIASLPNPPSEATVQLGAAPGGSEKCKAWLAIASQLTEAKVTFIEDGILIEEKHPGVFYPGFRAVVCAANLTKDLTGLKIVEDDRYRELLAWLVTESEKLRTKALASLALFPIRERVKERLASIDR